MNKRQKKTSTIKHWFNNCKGDTWCKYCNCTLEEHEELWPGTNKEKFHDMVASHGFGSPSKAGYEKALSLMTDGNYAEVAFEIVFLGLTKN